MRTVRILLWVLVALAFIGFATLLLYPRPGPVPANQAQANGIELINASSFGGPFTLVAGNGERFSSEQLKGKPYAIFFGFTHCPDVCPTTLARLVQLRQQLGSGADSFNIVFVSVDPERDTPEQVATYEQAFGGPVIALTGSPEQIEQVKKQYGIYSRKSPDGSGGYTVDHTASVLLFDREGGFSSTISPEESDDPALAKLKQLTA